MLVARKVIELDASLGARTASKGGTVGTGDGYIDMDGRNDFVGKEMEPE